MRTDDWREGQRRIRKKQRREGRVAVGIAGVIVGLGAVGLVMLLLLIGALSVWVGWNLGVVGAAKAFGDSVGDISIWTALGLSFLITCLGRLFRDEIKIERKAK